MPRSRLTATGTGTGTSPALCARSSATLVAPRGHALGPASSALPSQTRELCLRGGTAGGTPAGCVSKDLKKAAAGRPVIGKWTDAGARRISYGGTLKRSRRLGRAERSCAFASLCVCICLHVCMYIYVYACACAYICICLHVCMYMYVYIYVYVDVHAHVYVHVHVHVHVHEHVYVALARARARARARALSRC